MLPNGMRSAALAERCRLNADGLAPNVANATVRSITPCPAAAEVENTKFVADFQNADRVGTIIRFGQERRHCYDVARQRLRIMRGYDLAGERGVSEVLAIGVRGRIGKV